MLMPLFQLYAMLPGWLVSVLGFVFLGIQIYLMVDCLRNRRDFYWLWLLWVIPLIGAVAYWFYFKWPDSRLEYWLFRRGNWRRHLAELEAAATHVGNAANFEELGDELWRQKNFAAAEQNYRKALAKDPKLRDARARLGYCLVAQNRAADGWPYIEAVLAEKRDHDHEHLLREAARCRRAM